MKINLRKTHIYTVLAAALILTAQFSFAYAQSSGEITGFKSGMVRVNWGISDGIVQGTLMNVFQEVDIVHPVTGEKFGTSESMIGKIEVVDCLADYCLSKIISVTKQFEIGNVVRISFEIQNLSVETQDVERASIINVNNKLVKFNMGRRDGVDKNLLFDIFRVTGPTMHPSTGESISTSRTYIGKIMVINVSDRDATAQIISQEQDVLIGDQIVLSVQQSGDIELERAQAAQEIPETTGETPIITTELETAFSMPDNVVGTVTKIEGRDVYFIWRAEYDFPSGRVFGIYRREELRHPETNKFVGKPLILLGKITLIESIGKLGRASLVNFDAEILPRDLVGLTEGETIESGQIITPGNASEVFKSQRSDILRLAQELTEDLRRTQGEMEVLKVALDRLDRIDRDLESQKALTQTIINSIDEIKSMLISQDFTGRAMNLRPTGASVKQMEIPGSNRNVLMLNYTDDIKVRFELVDNTVFVSLDVDSTGQSTGTILPAGEETQAAAQEDSAQSLGTRTGPGASLDTVDDTEPDEGSSFFSSVMFWAIVIVVLLGTAGALYYLLIMKKKDSDDDKELKEPADSPELEDIEADVFIEEEFVSEEEEMNGFDEEL